MSISGWFYYPSWFSYAAGTIWLVKKYQHCPEDLINPWYLNRLIPHSHIQSRRVQRTASSNLKLALTSQSARNSSETGRSGSNALERLRMESSRLVLHSFTYNYFILFGLLKRSIPAFLNRQDVSRIQYKDALLPGLEFFLKFR